jgi:hypothetical protein
MPPTRTQGAQFNDLNTDGVVTDGNNNIDAPEIEGFVDEAEGEITAYTTIKNEADKIELTPGPNIGGPTPVLASVKITSATVDYSYGSDPTIGSGNVSEQDVWFIGLFDSTGSDRVDEISVPVMADEYSSTEAEELTIIAGSTSEFDPAALLEARIESLLPAESIDEIPLKSFNRIITKGKL